MIRFLAVLILTAAIQDPKPPKPPAAIPQAKVDETLKLAMGWLLRHQSENGSWHPMDHATRCGKSAPFTGTCVVEEATGRTAPVVTAMVLWALAAGGLTAESTDPIDGIVPGEAIKKACDWMVTSSLDSGLFGDMGGYGMENHLITLMAMAKAAGPTPREELKEPLAKALKYALDGQNAGAGWRYTPKSGDNDSFITGFGFLGLRGAEAQGLEVPAESYLGVLAWFEKTTDNTGGVGYTHKGTGKLVDMGKKNSADYAHHQVFTGTALAARMICAAKKDDPTVKVYGATLAKDPPNWDKDTNTDFWYWLNGTLGMKQWNGPDGKEWKAWKTATQATIVPHQNIKEGECRRGSWDPVDRTGHHGGRVLSTAQVALTLAATSDAKAMKYDVMKSPPKKK